MVCKAFFAPNSLIFLKRRGEEEERKKSNRKALRFSGTQKALKVLKHRFQRFKVSLNSKSFFGNVPF